MSKDKRYIMEFVRNLSISDYAKAEKSLHKVIQEKIKNRIRSITETFDPAELKDSPDKKEKGKKANNFIQRRREMAAKAKKGKKNPARKAKRTSDKKK